MTFITAKDPPTASISEPSKAEFHVFACSFSNKFFAILRLKFFDKRIEMFETNVADVHISKALVAIDISFLSR